MSLKENKRCTKVQYQTKKEADTMLSFIRQQGRKDQTIPKRTYYCGMCRKWHITKTEGDVNVSFDFVLPRDAEIVKSIEELLHKK